MAANQYHNYQNKELPQRPENNANNYGNASNNPYASTGMSVYEAPVMTQPDQQNTEKKADHKTTNRQMILKAGIIFICACLFIILVIVALQYWKTTSVPSSSTTVKSENLETNKTVYKSCLGLFQGGFKEDGIYKITNSKPEKEIEVYCDMSSAGGGWTLVASVVNEDPYSRCSSLYDAWSYKPYTQTARLTLRGSYNWENEKSFGNICCFTNSDFKSPTYYNLMATDVMMVHVPRETPITEIRSMSIYRYFTSNNFLKKYSSTLSKLFYNHAVLRSLSAVGGDKVILDKLKKYISISSLISNWSNYNYDRGTSGNYIHDGGNDMLDIGNKVFFSINGETYKQITYGKTYTESQTYQLSSVAMQPFITLATINSAYNYANNFKIKVESLFNPYGSSSAFSYSKYYKNVYYYFYGYEIYNRGSSPSVCSVMFYIRPTSVWASSNFHASIYPSYSNGNFTMEMKVNNIVRNGLVGYVLLAKTYPNRFSSTTIFPFFDALVDIIVGTNLRNLHTNLPSLSFPVQFEKGSMAYPNHNVTAGYIEFCVYDSLGYPYAVCPGLKVGSNADPSKFCIGSANTQYGHSDLCGDFAAWYKLKEHIFENRVTNGGRRFVNDLQTSILIFTRNNNEILTN